MKFIFEWKNYFTSEHSERVIFYYLGMSVWKIKKNLDEKQRNDVSDIFTSEDIENISLVSRM